MAWIRPSTSRPRRARSWSRSRCCSSPAWTAATTRRSPSSPTRRSAPSAPASRGHEAVDERTKRAAHPGGEGGPRDVRGPQRRHPRGVGGELSEVLGRLTASEHPQPPPLAAAPRAPAPRRARPAAARPGGGCSCCSACWSASAAAIAVHLAAVRQGGQGDPLPLRHEDVIRQQASDKGLDPSLIAAVIYIGVALPRPDLGGGRQGADAAAARRPRTTSPTCRAARRSSRATSRRRRSTSPTARSTSSTCCTKYRGSEVLALAAYNAGEGKVDEWLRAPPRRRAFTVARHIPFPETRAYVAAGARRPRATTASSTSTSSASDRCVGHRLLRAQRLRRQLALRAAAGDQGPARPLRRPALAGAARPDRRASCSPSRSPARWWPAAGARR